MSKKQKFAIKKLSIGVVSVCIGYAFLVQAPVVQASELASDSSVIKEETLIDDSIISSEPIDSTVSEPDEKAVSEEAVVSDSIADEKEVKQPERQGFTGFRMASPAEPEASSVDSSKNALDLLNERQNEFAENDVINSYDSAKQKELNTLLLTNFETKADEVAMTGVVSKKSFLTGAELTKYVTPLLTEFKKKNGMPFSVNQMTPEQQQKYFEYAKEAQVEGLRLVNATITNNDELESVASATKNVFKGFLDKGILSDAPRTIADLKSDLPALFRGAFLLAQQYDFEDGLVDKLVYEPHTIKGIAADTYTPYERLKKYGGVYVNLQRGGFLKQNESLFHERKVSEFTGFDGIPELVEHLANKHQMSPDDYYKNRTEALLGETKGESVYDTIRTKKSELYLPILSQGKGLYAAASQNAFTIGMTETYLDQQPREKLSKERGQNQPTDLFFMPMLEGFNHYMTFLESVKKADIPFVTAKDSLNHKYELGKGKSVWSEAEGPNAADAVRRFFTPMRLRESYQKSGVGIGGVSTSAASLVAYETRLMNTDMSGVGLFTHEMTHGNDQAAMYGGVYASHGRRNGQGPEIFARGMFEAIDNTQGTSPYSPVFNINTAIPIAKTEGRVQSSQPLNHKDKLETHMKHLLDLVAYLEVKEAEVALEVLTDEEKALYFNKVSQASPTKAASNGAGTFIPDDKRVAANSTNDRFMPFGQLGNEQLGKVTTIADLVKKDAVSGQFIPNGVSPLMPNLQTNQYDTVPLLESFYAASVATPDKNTVGDISFKRHAYEIIGWLGWDAYVAYASNQFSNDADAFKSILKNETAPDWESFKINKYETLSAKKPVAQLWDEANLKEQLKAAIKADLQHLRTLREQVDSLLTNYEDNRANRGALTSKAVSTGFASRAINVRNVKLGILRSALNHNELMSSVLRDKEYDIIYVDNLGKGDGETPTTPMSDLTQALAKVRDGGKIVLVGNVTERQPVTITKPVTIEAQTPSTTLLLNEELTVNANLALKNLTLNMIPEGTKTPTIRVTDQALTMENVTTDVARRPELSPVIHLHGDQSRLSVSGNTVLKQVQVHNAADVSFATHDVRVKEGLLVLAQQNETVTVLSKSNFITSMTGNSSSQLNVTLDSNFSNMSLSNIHDLTLTNGARATLNPVEATIVNHHLTVDKGSNLSLEGNSLTVDRLSGEGEINMTVDSHLTAQSADASVSGMTITFRKSNLDFSDYDGKRFVYLLEKAADPTVTLVPLNHSLSPNSHNEWIYKAEKRVVYHFVSDTDKDLPTTLQDYLPKPSKVVTGDTIALKAIDVTLDDADGKGEWVFIGWTTSDDEPLNTLNIDKTIDSVTDIYGTWHYHLKPLAPVVETRKEVIPYTTTYVADATLSVGKQVVEVTGVNGEKTYTITDGVSDNGRITKPAVHARVKVGTKPTVVVEEVPFETRYVADESKTYSPDSQPVERVAGENGQVISTTTYTVDAQNGSLTSQTETVRKESVTRYLVIGTGSTTRTEVIPFNIVEESSKDILKDQRLIKVIGQNGEKRYTDTYLLDTVSGQVTKQTDTVGVISIAPKDQLVLVGTLLLSESSATPPVVVLEEAVVSELAIPYSTEVISTPELPLGVRKVRREGVDGRRRLIHVGEELVSEEVITPAVSALIEEGTKVETTIPNNAPVLDLPEASVRHLVERDGNVLKYYDIWQDSKGHIIEKVLISSRDLAENSIKGQELLAVEENISPSQNKMSSDDMSSELGDNVESYVAKPTNTVLPKTGDQSKGLLSILSSLGLSLGLLGLKGKKED